MRTPGVANGTADGVVCEKGHHWPVEDGVLVFTRQDPPSDSWTLSQKDFAAYRETTPRWVKLCSSLTAPIVEALKSRNSSLHLDICTGQGGLLYNLIQHVQPEQGFLSVDMSLHVQQLNRGYACEIYPDKEIGFVSADASQLPIADSSVETVSSYHMGNMLEKMRPGIKEVARVLCPGGLFVFNHISIAEGSKGWQAFDREMRAMGATDYRFAVLRAEFEDMMKRSGFAGYQIKLIGETIGDPNRDWESGPTFPFPNEPMAELLVTAWK